MILGSLILQKMAKEISVRLDPVVEQAFSEAAAKNDHLRNLNPHFAVRFAIADQFKNGGEVEVRASRNGGPVEVMVNGEEVTGGGVLTTRGLESVVEVYCKGKGPKIAASMLSGSPLRLRTP